MTAPDPIKAGTRLDSFAVALRDAMTARGHSLASLKRLTGIAESTISYYLAGDRLPTLQRADELASALDAALLSHIAIRALRRKCDRCGRTFYADAHNRHHTRYCSKACVRAVARARQRKAAVTNRRIHTTKLERAVTAHCRWCQPDGICRDSECALRPVSPLPLIQLERRRAA